MVGGREMFNLDLSKISYESVEREIEGVKFFIRPYPLSEEIVEVNNSLKLKYRCKKWIYVVTGWEIKDVNGKDLPCSDDVKERMFNFSDKLKVTPFIVGVLREADKIRDIEEASIKN